MNWSWASLGAHTLWSTIERYLYVIFPVVKDETVQQAQGDVEIENVDLSTIFKLASIKLMFFFKCIVKQLCYQPSLLGSIPQLYIQESKNKYNGQEILETFRNLGLEPHKFYFALTYYTTRPQPYFKTKFNHFSLNSNNDKISKGSSLNFI